MYGARDGVTELAIGRLDSDNCSPKSRSCIASRAWLANLSLVSHERTISLQALSSGPGRASEQSIGTGARASQGGVISETRRFGTRACISTEVLKTVRARALQRTMQHGEAHREGMPSCSNMSHWTARPIALRVAQLRSLAPVEDVALELTAHPLGTSLLHTQAVQRWASEIRSNLMVEPQLQGKFPALQARDHDVDGDGIHDLDLILNVRETVTRQSTKLNQGQLRQPM